MIRNIGIVILLLLLYYCKPKVEPVDKQNVNNDSISIVDSAVVDSAVITAMVIEEPVEIEPRLTIKQQLSLKLDSQLYVREIAPNRSPEIDTYNRNVKAPLGSKWCASFVSYNLTYFGIPNPNSAWSPSFSAAKDVIWKPKMKTALTPDTGDVVSYYNAKLKRVYHVGVFGYFDKNGVPIVYEGNTSGGFGGVDNDGDGVYKKKRDLNKIYAISRYIKE